MSVARFCMQMYDICYSCFCFDFNRAYKCHSRFFIRLRVQSPNRDASEGSLLLSPLGVSMSGGCAPGCIKGRSLLR